MTVWKDRKGPLFVDVFVPKEIYLSQRECSVPLSSKKFSLVSKLPSDLDDQINFLSKDESNRASFVENGSDLLQVIEDKCDLHSTVFYMCFRKGNLKDQPQIPEDISYDDLWIKKKYKDYVNPCMRVEPFFDSKTGEKFLSVGVGGSGAYLKGGNKLKTWYGISNALSKQCATKIKDEYVMSDCGIIALIKDLNEKGYPTKYSCSGLASDHFGVPRIKHKFANTVKNPYLFFDKMTPATEACLIKTIGQDPELKKSVHIDLWNKEKGLSLYFMMDKYKDEDKDTYDKKVDDLWERLSRVLLDSECSRVPL